MPVPHKLLEDWPDDEKGKRMTTLGQFLLTSSLADQLGDRMTKRLHQDDLKNISIDPVDPLDIFLKVMQEEIIRLKEDNNLLSNTVRSLESNNQVILGVVKKTLRKIEILEKVVENYGRNSDPKPE